MTDIRVTSSVKVMKSLYPLIEGTGTWQESVWMTSSGNVGRFSDGGYGNHVCFPSRQGSQMLGFGKGPEIAVWKLSGMIVTLAI